MNAAEVARLRFQALVARGLASSDVAARVGLAAASEVWGGGEPRDRPAWYLWLRDAPRAWQLELAGAESIGTRRRPAVVARFTVRHYPSLAEPSFGRFSPEERRIASKAFDATGTPRIELAASIPDALFAIAAVEWAFELEGDAAVVALSSLDRLRSRTARGDVVRDVPGWSLGTSMLSLVSGLDAQVERRTASRVVISRQPGFEVVLSEPDGHREAPDTVHGEALVVLSRPGSAPDAAAPLLDALRDLDAEIVADTPLVPGARAPLEIAADPRLPVPVSSAWFGGEEHVHDLVACAC